MSREANRTAARAWVQRELAKRATRMPRKNARDEYTTNSPLSTSTTAPKPYGKLNWTAMRPSHLYDRAVAAAVRNSHELVADLLVRHREPLAEPDQESNFWRDLFLLAAAKNSVRVLNTLADKDISETTIQEATEDACRLGNIKLVNLLLSTRLCKKPGFYAGSLYLSRGRRALGCCKASRCVKYSVRYVSIWSPRYPK